MFDGLLTWARRNTRRAVALAIAPGFLLLSVDAAIGHFMGGDFDIPLQFVPVIFGVLSALVLAIVVWPKRMAPFAWSARIIGAGGFVVGIVGTFLHLKGLMAELKGDYSWPSIEGGLDVGPPVFAPLAFTGVGALVFLLPSARLLIRFRVGRPRPQSARRPPVPLQSTERRERVG